MEGTLHYGLQIFSSSTTYLVAYSDADWARCPTTRRSTSGYCVFLGNNLLSCSSKRQLTLSRSSAEAEYCGVANVVAGTCWLRNLLRELHTPLSSAMLVYCDNVSAVYLSCNPVQHQRTKHIEIDIYFVRDLVAAGQETLHYGLQIFSSSTTDLVAYSDADWAGCPTTRRSTSGYCVFLGNNLLSCSSAEAEYRGVANVVAGTCWLRNLLRELHTPLSSATLVYCDNVSAVYLSYNPVQHQRTKHIEIDIHFVRDLVAAGQVRVLHVPSRYQFADIFTKGLSSALFEEFRSSLSVRCPPAQTAGEC
ncbi:ribonuclease H-like domain-containing protein [Tanacetum coccineum]